MKNEKLHEIDFNNIFWNSVKLHGSLLKGKKKIGIVSEGIVACSSLWGPELISPLKG